MTGNYTGLLRLPYFLRFLNCRMENLKPYCWLSEILFYDKNTDSIKYINALANGTDLDNVFNGIYRCADTSHEFLNCPISEKLFTLECIGVAGSSTYWRGTQRITVDGSDCIMYTRTRTANNVWTEWKQHVLSSDLVATGISITTPSTATWAVTWYAKKVGNIVIASGTFKLNHENGQPSNATWTTTASGIKLLIDLYQTAECGIEYPVSVLWKTTGQISITNRGSKELPSGSTFCATFVIPIN